MFSLKVIDTDAFLDMPISSRLLYYELSIRADDDGFISSPKKITRMVGCSEDDLKMLIMKRSMLTKNHNSSLRKTGCIQSVYTMCTKWIPRLG